MDTIFFKLNLCQDSHPRGAHPHRHRLLQNNWSAIKKSQEKNPFISPTFSNKKPLPLLSILISPLSPGKARQKFDKIKCSKSSRCHLPELRVSKPIEQPIISCKNRGLSYCVPILRFQKLKWIRLLKKATKLEVTRSIHLPWLSTPLFRQLSPTYPICPLHPCSFSSSKFMLR